MEDREISINFENNIDTQNRSKINELLKIREELFTKQIIGSTPGLEVDDILFFNKNFNTILNKIDFDKPYKVISNLFQVEDDFSWIKDALDLEKEKSISEQEKNIPLKLYLQETLQNMIDSFQDILNNKKIGYLFHLIVSKYILELLRISHTGGLQISDAKLDFGPGGINSISQLIAHVPSVEDSRLLRTTFMDKNGETFRIKYGSFDKQNEKYQWVPIENIPEYRNINPDLIKSQTIIHLLSFDNFFFFQNDLPVSEISFKERIIFYNFVLKKNEFEIHQIFSCYEKLNKSVDFFRTFFAIQHTSDEMGQKILDLGVQLPTETALKIFSKYTEIIDSVENVLHVVQNNFKSVIDTKPELLQSVEQSLYKRGADLLSQFHNNINQNPDEIIAELERINADTITTLSIFKYAAKFGNKLPLEDITDAEFSKKTGNELSPAEIAEMEHIYQSNWKNYGNQQLIQSVIQKFKESLTGEHATNEQVYTFKKDNQINAFVKFSELQLGVKYASALNVDQSSKGFGLGETMMDEALYREAQENILIATCDPYNDSNMRYFEKGFVGTGFTGDNPPVMNICWNESMNTHISSKFISVDDLVVMYLKKQVPNNLVIKKGKTLQEIHTNIPTGKSLTRCFKDPLHTGDWYAVYESIPVEYETNIKTTE